MGIAVQMLPLQPYLLQQCSHCLLAFIPLIYTMDLHRLADQLQHIQAGIQRGIRVLEDGLNPSAERLKLLLA
ncbi:hypothetical protein D3C75_1254820 [compost metagenome]